MRVFPATGYCIMLVYGERGCRDNTATTGEVEMALLPAAYHMHLCRGVCEAPGRVILEGR